MNNIGVVKKEYVGWWASEGGARPHAGQLFFSMDV